ncbi:AraC family transcriptional regulator [Spongiimicrobium sp. 3-5]|uniref:AraC family transcriptional regulator n=1 Tax=Spongiimicrobium sp. 3-5 TaxID=3332596 RepID=UPI00397ED54B
MKPIYENIEVGMNSSLKIATYVHSDTCELTSWHVHPEYELVYVKNGKGTLRIDSKTLAYDDGTLIFLGPNIPHADFGNKDYRDNLEVVIQFRKDFVEEKLGVFQEFKAISKLIQRSGSALLYGNETKEQLSVSFERFGKLNNTEQLINVLAILEKLSKSTDFHAILGNTKLSNFKNDEIKRLELVFEYVNENYGDTIGSKVLADHVGLTTNSFCRFFKKMTHQSFIQFVNEFRIRKAKELLDENMQSIAEVMYNCGYNDPSYFTRQFKKYLGQTPTAYLAKISA